MRPKPRRLGPPKTTSAIKPNDHAKVRARSRHSRGDETLQSCQMALTHPAILPETHNHERYQRCPHQACQKRHAVLLGGPYPGRQPPLQKTRTHAPTEQRQQRNELIHTLPDGHLLSRRRHQTVGLLIPDHAQQPYLQVDEYHGAEAQIYDRKRLDGPPANLGRRAGDVTAPKDPGRDGVGNGPRTPKDQEVLDRKLWPGKAAGIRGGWTYFAW